MASDDLLSIVESKSAILALAMPCGETGCEYAIHMARHGDGSITARVSLVVGRAMPARHQAPRPPGDAGVVTDGGGPVVLRSSFGRITSFRGLSSWNRIRTAETPSIAAQARSSRT